MTVLLSQSEQTKDKLKLFLSDDQGRPSDALSVRWTVQTHNGRVVSGERVPAVKKATGSYYATWLSDVPTGSYQVLWEYQLDGLSKTQRILQPFYIIEPTEHKYSIHKIIKENPPAPGSLVFLPYSYLGPNDLFISINDENGYPFSVYSISWYIHGEDDHRHHHHIQKSPAIQAAVGLYFAPWVVTARSGTYEIVWEYQADATSPLQKASQQFSVLGHETFFKIVLGSVNDTKFIIVENKDHRFCVPYENGCLSMSDRSFGCGKHQGSRFFMNPCSPCRPPFFPPFPIAPCCDYEISRQIHLPTTVLPLGGSFTNQSPFSIPTRIKTITFYIKYARGAPNGFATFRLLWGNGVEETQETIRDIELVPEDTSRAGQNLFIQDLLGPAPVDDNPINFILSVLVPGGVTTVRLITAEGGVPISPGTIEITLTAST